jgi:hypothetical protein
LQDIARPFVSCCVPQGLRQQLLQQQSAAARAESAAKADSSAAVHASKQLALQEKQHKAEVGVVGGGGVRWLRQRRAHSLGSRLSSQVK